MTNTNNLAAFIWSLADLLRGDFRQSQYGRVILPFALLRRLECVLEKSKPKVLEEYKKIKKKKLPEEAEEKLLLRSTNGLQFFNKSLMDLSKLGESDIKDNLESYIQAFSSDAREIFEHFKFNEFIAQLDDANLLYKVVKKVREADLSLKSVSNHDMGLVFEELIRKFAESSNDTAGEHFTPRDIVRLTTSLVFMEDDEALTKSGVIRTLYDPTAGTGGFLSSGMEYVHELNPKAVMRAYGQELNGESYAICKADMLIKGQEVKNIKLGNTLSEDQLYSDKFDYMLSNPPFGVDWKKIDAQINKEHTSKGYNGRFGPGLPRVSDGSLLFLLHLINKLRDREDGGGRIGIILNGSPLFTGSAGSGESEIRRYILEKDLLESIIALPTDMFYNTPIGTYIWIISNKKDEARRGKVQLINGVNLYKKMRKSLGSKRKEMSEEDIGLLAKTFGAFERIEAQEISKRTHGKSNRGRKSLSSRSDDVKTFSSKIFNTYDFGYRRITIERPLRESFQFSDERVEELRFAPKPLNLIMKWIYNEFGDEWTEETYGNLESNKEAIRKYIKTHFKELKEKNIKDVLDKKTWKLQLEVFSKAKQIQSQIGKEQFNNMNEYEMMLQNTDLKLDSKEKKKIINAVSWKNPEAEKVIKKIHKCDPSPLYGLFEVDGEVIEYKPDGDLRDFENINLDPSRNINDLNEVFFKEEVLPHVSDAWIDSSKKDKNDEGVGIVGYEIPFNRHFYNYNPPRSLEQIDTDLLSISSEVVEMIQELHS